MGLLITSSTLMHIQQMFGEKAVCTASPTSKGIEIIVDNGIERYEREFHYDHIEARESAEIFVQFVKDAKHYFASSK